MRALACAGSPFRGNNLTSWNAPALRNFPVLWRVPTETQCNFPFYGASHRNPRQFSVLWGVGYPTLSALGLCGGDLFPGVAFPGLRTACLTPGYVISGFQPESHFYPFAEGEKYLSLGQRPRKTIPPPTSFG